MFGGQFYYSITAFKMILGRLYSDIFTLSNGPDLLPETGI